MKKIGIFYGPEGGSTEKVAKLIQTELGSSNAELNLIKNAKATDLDKYENIIFGCSTIGTETWDATRTKPDWDIFRPEFEKISYKGKTFAIFGLGDHISYPHQFVDSMGVIGKSILSNDAKVIGQCNTADYEFIESEAVIDWKFVGLPIDEEFDSEKTNSRITSWLEILKQNFS